MLMSSSSSLPILSGVLSPPSYQTPSSSFAAFAPHCRLKASYRKSEPQCRCSLRFQERSESEASYKSENTRSEGERRSNPMMSSPPPPPPPLQRKSIDGEDEVSGIQVPRQKYIPISKSKLLDAIALFLLEGDEVEKENGDGIVDEFLQLSSCLDSILHVEHKRILEDMRVDYVLTHCGDEDSSGSEGNVLDDGAGRESDGGGEVWMGLDYGLEELKKMLLGSSGKERKSDSDVDSRSVDKVQEEV